MPSLITKKGYKGVTYGLYDRNKAPMKADISTLRTLILTDDSFHY